MSMFVPTAAAEKVTVIVSAFAMVVLRFVPFGVCEANPVAATKPFWLPTVAAVTPAARMVA